MRIYIAGASKDPDRIRKWMSMVAECPDLDLTHDWLADLANETTPDHELPSNERARYASIDLRGVETADILWLLAPETGKGAWIEYGYALARGASCTTVASGPVAATSIFSACATREYVRDEDAWEWIQELAQPGNVKTFSDWQEEVHNTARNNGWYDGAKAEEHSVENKLVRLALVHSEASEAVECVRDDEPDLHINEKGKPLGLASELADVVIRCMDMAAWLDLDLEGVIDLKNEYNKTRGHRHGGKVV